MNKICQNCKYHYIEEISFDYPQSCCNKEEINYTTEPGLHCDNFEYSEEYMKKQLETYKNVIKEALKTIHETDNKQPHYYKLKSDLLNILNKVGDDNANDS